MSMFLWSGDSVQLAIIIWSPVRSGAQTSLSSWSEAGLHTSQTDKPNESDAERQVTDSGFPIPATQHGLSVERVQDVAIP